MAGNEIIVPFMGGRFTFQDPFDFDADDGTKRHVNARVVITGGTSPVKLEVPYLMALGTAMKITEVREWLQRNAPPK